MAPAPEPLVESVPVPEGAVRTSPADRDTDAPVFVVHRHDARRLHYDLRLEMNGVLVSWAIPRGISYDPADKRLAVHTEDHPMEYETFEGVIPKGEYGAGTMTIFDRGHYEVLNGDPSAAVEGGDIKLVLHGRRFRGEWHVIRTKGQNPDATTRPGREWLIFKARDRYARPDGEPLFDLDLGDAKPRPFPTRWKAMQPATNAEAFTDPEWVFELGFRGVRGLIRVDGDDLHFACTDSRWQAEAKRVAVRRRLLPEVLERELRRVRAKRAVFDGVLVALDETQRPSAEAIEHYLLGNSEDGGLLQLYLFDLLYFDEWDLRPFPLVERKRALRSLLPKLPHVLYVDHVASRGEPTAAVAASAGLDHVIAKRAESPYRAGESEDWLSIPLEAEVDDENGVFESDVFEALESRADPSESRIKFSNLDKVYWPQEGYTKRDLIGYYEAVAEYMLPYLHNRPVGMRRFPDGIDGKSFYHKRVPDHAPEWVQTVLVTDSEGRNGGWSSSDDEEKEELRSIICNDRDTLLYLANLGSIDVHPWLSTIDDLESPDWALIDLDPDGTPFPQVVQVARAVGKVLSAIGVKSSVKTSGASGIHIYVRLKPGYTYAHSRVFCEGVARVVARELPKIATVERSVGKRGGKVYIDFLQNHRGQTVAPPYAVRPVPGATVSTPLEWDELHSELTPADFTIHTAPARFARVGDLFRDALTEEHDLLSAIEGLEEYLKG